MLRQVFATAGHVQNLKLHSECSVDASLFEALGGQSVQELSIYLTINYTNCKMIDVSIETMMMPVTIVFLGKHQDKLILLAIQWRRRYVSHLEALG
ncbi:hypothetical protein DL765_003201 [Monosporascus sp. GIB2]|nr:hypothetical protein DL765_003201 [Monosporascus sp. GIB2]